MAEWSLEHIQEDGVESASVLRLKGDVTLESISELKNGLLEALEQESALVVDCEKVEKIDLAGLQLLCAAHRAALSQNKKFSLRGCDEGIFKAAQFEAGLIHQSSCLFALPESGCCWAPAEKE